MVITQQLLLQDDKMSNNFKESQPAIVYNKENDLAEGQPVEINYGTFYKANGNIVKKTYSHPEDSSFDFYDVKIYSKGGYGVFPCQRLGIRRIV